MQVVYEAQFGTILPYMSEYLDNADRRILVLREIADAVLEQRFSRTMASDYEAWIQSVLPADIIRLVDGYLADGIDMTKAKPMVSALLNLFHKPLAASGLKPDAHPFPLWIVREGQKLLDTLSRMKPLMATLIATAADNPSAPSLQDTPALSAHQDTLRHSAPQAHQDTPRHSAPPAPPATLQPETAESLRKNRSREAALAGAREGLKNLAECERLFQAKENILFPRFEKSFPQYRCVSLMWSIQNDVLRDIARFQALLDPQSPQEHWKERTSRCMGQLYFNISTLAFRDRCILLPFASTLFTDAEFDAMAHEALDFGAVMPRSPAAARAPSHSGAGQPREPSLPGALAAHDAPALPGSPGTPDAPAVDLGSGKLDSGVLAALFRTLPQDMTFVDSDDRVAFFSEGPHRIFPRTRSILGRKVADCHPAESVDRVMHIVESFKTGEKDRESFWLTKGGRWIHIEYRAVRDSGGRYLGTLEVSEDLTEKRSLTGEKRLL